MKLKPRSLKKTKPPIYKKYLLILGMIVIGFFLLVLILTPLRNWGAHKYLERGNQKLSELDYIAADIEYQKASLLTPCNSQINSQISLARDSEKNLLLLGDFFQDQDVRSTLNDLEAIGKETEPQKLVTLSQDFINQNRPAMAVVAAKKAVSQKENYRDGLLYLAIAYDRAARVSTIRQESADYLLSQSRKYLQLAHESDPTYFLENPD